MIAIMGAAGNVGRKVADLLLDAGMEVRVLQHARGLDELRARGADVVEGDATDVGDLRRLFAGASAVLVLLPEDVADPSFVENRNTMSRAIRDALRAENVTHVVVLSAVGAGLADAPGPPGGLNAFEQDLRELESCNLLALRSAAYMDYLLAALPMIQAQKINGSAVEKDARFPMIATEDVAREAAKRLRERDFAGHTVKFLLGPEDITMTEATKAIGERIGLPDLPYVTFPPADVMGALQGAGMSAQVASLIVDMQIALSNGTYMEGIQRDSESTTPTRLETFLSEALRDHGMVKTEPIG